jgi:hypothetical protein
MHAPGGGVLYLEFSLLPGVKRRRIILDYLCKELQIPTVLRESYAPLLRVPFYIYCAAWNMFVVAMRAAVA